MCPVKGQILLAMFYLDVHTNRVENNCKDAVIIAHIAVAVALTLALTLQEFNAVKVAFLEALRKSIASRHPTAVCKLWKTTLRTEVIAVTTGGRRLLQASGYDVDRYNLILMSCSVFTMYEHVRSKIRVKPIKTN